MIEIATILDRRCLIFVKKIRDGFHLLFLPYDYVELEVIVRPILKLHTYVGHTDDIDPSKPTCINTYQTFNT